MAEDDIHHGGNVSMVWYALATCRNGNAKRSGLAIENAVLDLEEAFAAVYPGRDVPSAVNDLTSIIAEWQTFEPLLEDIAPKAVDLMKAGKLSGRDRGDVALAPPIVPHQLFAAAANYIEHANEMGTKLAAKVESNPFIFIKAATSVVGHEDQVLIPEMSKMVDWEVELGVVIGKAGKNIPVERALDVVAGYTIVNDVSARDLNLRDDFPFKFDWFQGKSFDTFAPIGPWIVPRSCIADPQDLRMSLTVNDKKMQDATTAEMIFTAAEQISYLSKILTLCPGDVIATGTPTGVGMAHGVFLKPGDTMVASIQGIGELANPIAAAE
jgi:2,4-diketo-3-deoxy-L-fuconate hydrolase